MGLNIDLPRIGLILASLIVLPFLLISMMPSISRGSSSVGGGFGGIWATLLPYLIPLAIIVLAFLFIFIKKS